MAIVRYYTIKLVYTNATNASIRICTANNPVYVLRMFRNRFNKKTSTIIIGNNLLLHLFEGFTRST